ncbi:hypothetical protein BDV09DRAFT_189365 [Aspergillus tetrazonus]
MPPFWYLPLSKAPSPSHAGLLKQEQMSGGNLTSGSTSPYSPQQSNECYFVEKGDSCSAILSKYDILMAEFYSWNPTVGSDCSTMEYGYYVCVGVSASTTTSTNTGTTTTATSTGPSPTQSGVTSSYRIIEWNPAVGSNCADLWVGYYYCVATTAIQPMPNIISTCTQYYLVQSGDSCYSIEQEYLITSTEFYTWNPDVGTDCSALWSGYYVCIGV